MKRPAILLLAACMAAAPAHAGLFDDTKDPKDGKFDISSMLMSGKGLLAVPIVLTEPAIGFGLGAAVGFFHGKPPEDIDVWDESIALEDIPPPTVSGAAAMYTTNNSWFAGSSPGTSRVSRARTRPEATSSDMKSRRRTSRPAGG